MPERKRNEAEDYFRLLAGRRCWHQMKRGWPDFFCRRADGSFFVVEVKRRLESGELVMLKREQEEILDALSSLGMECYISDGWSLEPYDKVKHAPKKRRRYTRKVAIA